MSNEKLYVMCDGVKVPHRAHPTDAGIDLFSPVDVVIKARSSAVIKSRVKCVLPENTVGLVLPKSGLNINHDLLAFGVIDEPYRGEINVKLYNMGDEDYHLREGDKMTQMLVMPVLYTDVVEVDHIENDTDRGEGGIGSTGR